MARKNNYLDVVQRTVRKRVNQKVERACDFAYNETIDTIEKDVLNHSISRELMSKKTPSSFFANPIGSLFGFMGFLDTRQPVQELLNFLKDRKGYTLTKRKVGRLREIEVQMTGPDDQMMADNKITVDRWDDGRSWPEMIESGMVGLSQFLVKDGYGDSKEGFQVKDKTLRASDVTAPTLYLTPIFKKAGRNFRKLLRRGLQ